jgi:type IV secretion system protein VirD4
MNDRIRKHIISNIPYLFIMWAFLKLGTAFRLAAGATPMLKIVGMMETIGPGFADFAPGLYASDWLIGLAGAVLIRLMIYSKSKKARNSERMWSTVQPAGERKKT